LYLKILQVILIKKILLRGNEQYFCDIEFFYNKYMMHNKEEKYTKPYIFKKKVSNNYKVIPLLKEKNTLGNMRYFPPSSQE
jgi:hypothetical protein